jgi:phage protein D
MELAALSEEFGDFYAPAFSVRLAGADVVRDLLVAVSQVEAELVMNAASHFSFTLSNCYNLESGQFETGRGKPLLELLTLGTEVEVCIGYGDSASTPTTMLGQVTEISTNFPETGAPDLVVSGYDHGFPLTLGKNSDSWKDRKDSEVVQLIAGGFHQLATVIDDTADRHKQIEQNQQNDWEFLKTLAERNSGADKSVHYELYVDTGGAVKKPTLHFGLPRLDAAPVVKLKWGAGLLSFKPQANLAGQVSKVEVYGWDVKRKEAIIGRASASDAGPRGKTIAQHVGALVRAPDRQPTLRLRQPVFTQAEADKRARAALGEMTRKFLTGDAESVGLPGLRPDRTVELAGLGEAFSKIYYIEQASHRVDSGGYRTKFKVREAKR